MNNQGQAAPVPPGETSPIRLMEAAIYDAANAAAVSRPRFPDRGAPSLSTNIGVLAPC